MRNSKMRGFTLVELLVVIGIIALLIGILLPALNRACAAANTIKCSSNLRAIGQGIAMYVSENKGTLPAAYLYVGHSLVGGSQNPTTPVKGYIHWSSYLFGSARSDAKFSSAAGGLGITSAQPGPYATASGWEVFQCPSLDNGGLPPTDPAPGNFDPGVAADVTGYVDYQAPRLAYTLNEVLCPRNKFASNMPGNPTRLAQYVRAGSVKGSADVILATEFTQISTIVLDTGDVGGGLVCKSHRPVHAFKSLTGGGTNIDLWTPGSGVVRVAINDLASNPVPGTTPKTRLDWVGRNHGIMKQGRVGGGDLRNDWDLRKTNFLYLDGHVETKHISETLSPWQWGTTLYSYAPHDDVLN